MNVLNCLDHLTDIAMAIGLFDAAALAVGGEAAMIRTRVRLMVEKQIQDCNNLIAMIITSLMLTLFYFVQLSSVVTSYVLLNIRAPTVSIEAQASMFRETLLL